MSVRDTGKVKGTQESNIEELWGSRDSYSEGKPVSGDSYQESEVAAARSQTVGFRQVLPVLTDTEAGEIESDLAPIARGIDMYQGLSPEEREGMSAQQFAVMFAMLEAFRHA